MTMTIYSILYVGLNRVCVFSLGYLLILSYRNRANSDNHVEISEKCRTLEKTAKYGCCWWWLSNIVEVVVRRVAVAKRDLKPEFGLNKARITFLGLAHKICHTLQQGSLFPQLFWRISQIHVSRHADLEFAEERMFQTVDNPTGKEAAVRTHQHTLLPYVSIVFVN